jgi:hypothetical protein
VAVVLAGCSSPGTSLESSPEVTLRSVGQCSFRALRTIVVSFECAQLVRGLALVPAVVGVLCRGTQPCFGELLGEIVRSGLEVGCLVGALSALLEVFVAVVSHPDIDVAGLPWRHRRSASAASPLLRNPGQDGQPL